MSVRSLTKHLLGLVVACLLVVLASPSNASAQSPASGARGNGVMRPIVCVPPDPCGYVVDVTPDSSVNWQENTGSHTQTFRVTNYSDKVASFNVTCMKTGVVTTLTGCASSSGSLAIGGSSTFTVTYAVGAAGVGYVKAEAHNIYVSDTAWVDVTSIRYGVAVTPDGQVTDTMPLAHEDSVKFKVKNTGSQSNTFTLGCGTSGEASSCGFTGGSATVAAGDSIFKTVHFNTGAIGTGVVSLTATGTNASDNGTFNIPVQRYGVAVTPDGGTETTRPANGGPFTAVFKVKNTGSRSNSFTVTCGGTGLTCSGTNASSPLTLAAGDSANVTATYTAGVSGTGTLTLSAAGKYVSDGGSYSVPIVAGAPTIVLVVPTETTTGRAVVRNRQPVVRALFTASVGIIDTTLTSLSWRGINVSTLARYGRGVLEWEPDSTRWLGVGDSAQVSVTACTTVSYCTTVTRWVVLPADNRPVLGFQGVPRGTTTPSFSGPFGPGLSVSGAEVETAIGTPAYTSMGVPRAAGLLYSTRTSYPRALVPIELELPWPGGTPDRVTLRLRDGATVLDTLSMATPTCATGALKRCRAVLQGDFSGTSFGTPTRKWLTVEAQVVSGATSVASVDSVEVVIVDRRTTRYGSGWWPAGVSQLVAAGGDRLVVAPNGVTTIYRGNADTTYVSNPGNTTALVKTATGWELRPRGSLARVVFDANGRLVASFDANGNKDSVAYNGATDQVTTFIDPVGMTIRLVYDGNGKISTFADSGGRVTRVTVNGTTNQLTRDSLPSATTAPLTRALTYQTYPGTGTVVLSRVIGVITDTVIVIYDSTFARRPMQVRLPQVKDETGANANPVITYEAVERRGYGGLVSLDSAYVEVRDSRNNWTRSLLNRWGQRRRTWDAIGLTSRAEYSPDGLVLWAEGKNGDSSRVYTDYDGALRPVRTWITRGGTILRTDSLVYDANHRVIERIDARGKKTKTIYDAAGNATRSISPRGDSTKVWYRLDGLIDSVRRPLDTLATRMTYDAVWKNLATATDGAGEIVAQKAHDAFGRDTVSDSRVAVEVTTSATLNQQWRRTQMTYNDMNQLLAVRTIRSSNCGSPCSAPGQATWNTNAADTLKVRSVTMVYDRAGRDSIRVNERNQGTVYILDRLGRQLSRHPWNDSLAVQDSMFFDVAGNVKKVITRRGHTITTNFDSRNRDTLTVIPTIGTRLRSYGGPQDQLTRVWYTSPVDSIGGINGEIRYGYDARGRLRADTAYTGATPRVATYAYDQYERTRSRVNLLGTWGVGYEDDRGIIDSVMSAFGDTLFYDFDAQGRPQQMSNTKNGVVLQAWGTGYFPGGGRSGYQTLMTGGGIDLYIGINQSRPFAVDFFGNTLAPYYLSERGAGGIRDSVEEKVVYDGWERVTSWTQKHWDDFGPPVTFPDAYAFDRTGNVNVIGGTTQFSGRSDQLTSVGAGSAFTYDAAGNQITWVHSGVTRSYGYDALNRLVSVRESGSLIARYAYDVLGRRIAKRVYSTSTGGTLGYTRFVYDGDQVSYEVDSTGTLGYQYVWGLGADNLVAYRDPSGTDFIVATDALGSVRTIGRKDGSGGGWLASRAYQPYGDVLWTTQPAFSWPTALRYGWTGREYDRETGFYFHRARYYSVDQRRFIQEDPSGYDGGANLYAYVDGRVLESRDPAGLRLEQSTWDLLAAGPDRGGCFPCTSADGELDLWNAHDYYYTIYGVVADKKPNGGHDDRYFLRMGGKDYRLDDPLKWGERAYGVFTEEVLESLIKGLAKEGPRDYGTVEIAIHSRKSGEVLDFKRFLGERTLYLTDGMAVHRDKIGNAAWGYYMASMGYSERTTTTGAWIQGAATGGESGLDQMFVRLGYRMFP